MEPAPRLGSRPAHKSSEWHVPLADRQSAPVRGVPVLWLRVPPDGHLLRDAREDGRHAELREAGSPEQEPVAAWLVNERGMPLNNPVRSRYPAIFSVFAAPAPNSSFETVRQLLAETHTARPAMGRRCHRSCRPGPEGTLFATARCRGVWLTPISRANMRRISSENCYPANGRTK